MDIDEFLDREIQGEKKEDVEEKPVSIQIAKEEEAIIKHYFELWNRVSDAKFNWDGSLHAELTKEGNRIKENLNMILLTSKGEKNTIRHLISKAITELRSGNYESAIKLYSEINEMRQNFPNFLLEEKRALNREVFRLYEEIHDKIDSKLVDDSRESIARVDSLIRDAFSYLKMGKVKAAKKIYEDALKVYRALPNGFLPQKIELGNGLLVLYKDLSIDTQIQTLQSVKEVTEGYDFGSKGGNLKHLAEIAKDKVKRSEKTSVFSNLRAISDEGEYNMPNKNLLSKLIARKLLRAKVDLKKGLYLEAKNNIESVFRIDPENKEAKQMLNSMPQ